MTPKRIDIDIRGQICPSSLLITLRELNRHGATVRAGGAEIVVTTDDRQATATIPATAERMGFRSEIARVGELYRIRIFSDTEPTPPCPTESTTPN